MILFLIYFRLMDVSVANIHRHLVIVNWLLAK